MVTGVKMLMKYVTGMEIYTKKKREREKFLNVWSSSERCESNVLTPSLPPKTFVHYSL